jgi:hypothetical protein
MLAGLHSRDRSVTSSLLPDRRQLWRMVSFSRRSWTMAKPERGIPALMMMPTPLDAPVDAQVETDEGQGSDSPAPAPKPRPQRRRVPVGGAGRGHKLTLPDAVFERLELTAIKRRSNISAIASEILDRNLPRLRIEQDA